MVRHGHFEAWIQLADNKRLPEYGLWINGKEAKTFIPCHRRETFEVHWQDHGSGLFTAAWIVVDGVPSSGRYIRGAGHEHRSGVRCGPESEIPYTFTEATGLIELKIAMVTDGSERPSDDPNMIKAKRDKLFKKNGLEHHATFVKDVPQQKGTTYSVSKHPGTPAESFVKFKFYYHPQLWLEKRNINELPSPEALLQMCKHSPGEGTTGDGSGSPGPALANGDVQSQPIPAPAAAVSESSSDRVEPERRTPKRASRRASKRSLKPSSECAEQERDLAVEMKKAQLDDQTMARRGRKAHGPDDPKSCSTKPRKRTSRARKPRKSQEKEEPHAKQPVLAPVPVTTPAPVPVSMPAPAQFPAPAQSTPPAPVPADSKPITTVNPPQATSPQMLLRERHRVEFEARIAQEYGRGAFRPGNMMPPLPADIQQYPGASNTYMLPSPSSSSSSSTTPRLPYSRPAANVIDATAFGHLPPAAPGTIDPRMIAFPSPVSSNASTAGNTGSGRPWC